ncbi:unnamed protein product [Paramecium octaurelia]|uniref:Uncharacterized protein n=1 Tax=Paramecium octaurelia TaxID=43137 RepID=A0A8S1UMJ8_PAROT|nr:unnamed protein product [Paramecium octaurelia]
MLKRNSHRQSDHQLRYSSLTKNDESEFNLGKFRESVYSKMQQLGNQEQQIYVKGTAPKTVKSSQAQELRGSIPSFEDIFKKMSSYKDNSHNILKHDGSLRSSIQCKIEQFADPPQSRLSQRSVGMTLHISNRFASQTKLDTKQQSTGKFTSSFIEKPVIAQPLKTSVMDKLPLKELIDIRNRVEGSTQSEVQQLSKNYVSELVKLAQIINKQVRRCKL